MIERVQVGGLQRLTAATGVGYCLVVSVILSALSGWYPGALVLYGVYTLLMAVPLAFPGLRGFAAACVVVAFLNLLLGLLLAIAGLFLFWPAILPLLVAPFQQSDATLRSALTWRRLGVAVALAGAVVTLGLIN